MGALSALLIPVLACATGMLIAQLAQVHINPVSDEQFAATDYDLVDMDAPRMAGLPLKVFAAVMQSPLIGDLVVSILKKKNAFSDVRSFAPRLRKQPTYYPLPMGKIYPATSQNDSSGFRAFAEPYSKPSEVVLDKLRKRLNAHTPQRFSIEDYHHAYLGGITTPTSVAKAFIAAVEESNSLELPLKAVLTVNEDMILLEAAESTKRYAAGTPLSLVDGVPIVVKGQVDVKGYETHYGTTFMSRGHIEKEDAPGVARLRVAGALLVGASNMHEIGIGTTGHNPHYGPARNPFNLKHHTGGSSSGPAAAVAAGLCPVAIGTDGGGSVRIPAALCGDVGLKATFARIPSTPADAWSVSHTGPIATTTRDATITYSILGGSHPNMPVGLVQPEPHLSSVDKLDSLSDIRVGVFKEYLEHANSEIVAAANKFVSALQSKGAVVTPTKIERLNLMKKAHAIIIMSELRAGLDKFRQSEYSKLSADTKSLLALAQTFSGADLLAALQVRQYAIEQMEAIFENVDVIVTPMTGLTAPTIAEDSLETGETNVPMVSALMRFAALANLSGIPGISCPVGLDEAGLPMSVQIMAGWWNEHHLLRLSSVCEKIAEMPIPPTYFSILSDAAKFL